MGLAIDGVRAYDQYARMERAAEAGALAGVIYMPNNYVTNISKAPFDNAVCRALQEVSKNGFGTYCPPANQPPGLGALCPSPPTSVEIAVCPVSGLPHDLRVYVTESINVVFLGALGVGPLTITAVAQAEYIPPVDVAIDPGATGGTGSWGTFGECPGASGTCTGQVRNWSGNINGPGELKEQGDPLVTCEEGGSGLTPSSPNGSSDAAYPSQPYNTFVGKPTNHPQYTTPIVGAVPAQCLGAGNNADTSNAFTGPTWYNDKTGAVGPQHAGYAFYVNIPSTAAAQNLWIWNAPFSPGTPKSCNGRGGGQGVASYDIFFQFNCSGSSASPYPAYPNTLCTGQNPYTCVDPHLFFSVTYSIYSIQSTTDPSGTLVASFTATPYEIGDHGCSYWQPDSPSYAGNSPATCVTTSNCEGNWCPVANKTGDGGALWAGATLGAGQYRVMVVASDYGDPSNFNAGYGAHAYSLKLCPTGTTQAGVPSCATPINATVAGWTLSDTFFSFPGNGAGKTQITEYPLGNIPSEFAGRTLDIQLYDPGDLNGNNSSASGTTVYAVAPPTAAADPCQVTSAQLSAAGYTSTNFLFPYNQRTAPFQKSSPLTGIEGSLNGDQIYNGLWTDEQIGVPSAYTGGSWTICAIAPQTNDSDILGIRVEALGESPVHLV